jgi:hypothetical protein
MVDCSRERFERLTSVLPSSKSNLFTDASNLGWGAYLDGLPVSGVWTPDLQKEHINFLEMKAVFLHCLISSPFYRTSLLFLHRTTPQRLHICRIKEELIATNCTF